MPGTTAIHYQTNNNISDASDINQFADIITGVTNAPGITVNSLTVSGTPVNFPAASIQASSLTGALTANNTSTGNNITIAGATNGNPVTITATANSDATVNINMQPLAGYVQIQGSTNASGVRIQGAPSGSANLVTTTGNSNLNIAPGGTGAFLTASSTAASTGINTTETVLVTFPLTPAQTLRAGSHIRLTAQGTNVSTVSNPSNFSLRAGTTGTTTDALVAVWSVASGTAGSSIAFSVTIDFAVRTLGAAGTGAGSMVLNQAAVNGILNTVLSTVITATSSTLATTTATFLTFSTSTNATTTTNTFQNVHIDVFS